MAFTAGTLHVELGPTAPAGGRLVVAHYATNDTLATVAGANYFDAAVKLLPKGSIISVHGDIDGTPAHQDYIVSANDGSAVTLTESKIA